MPHVEIKIDLTLRSFGRNEIGTERKKSPLVYTFESLEAHPFRVDFAFSIIYYVYYTFQNGSSWNTFVLIDGNNSWLIISSINENA